MVNSIKKPLFEVTKGKAFGFVKFKGEKAKNLSSPGNNLFWKEVLSNYRPGTGGKSIFLQLEQVSAMS